MRTYSISIFLLGYIALGLCMPSSSSSKDGNNIDNNDSNDDPRISMSIRSPKYNFGLGKRRYVIADTPGAKRLPHYNFGLGKRSGIEDNDILLPDDGSDEENAYSNLEAQWPGLFNNNGDEEYEIITKDGIEIEDPTSFFTRSERSKPFANRFQFGMGKRRTYNFGLGKRYSNNNDKRLPSRYNFGLGR